MLTTNDVERLTSSRAVTDFFSQSLGYRVDPVAFDATDLGIPEAPARLIRRHEVELLSDYQHQFQVYRMEVDSMRRTDFRAILEPFYRKHPGGNYLFVFTKDYSEHAFVSPVRVLADDPAKTKLRLRTLRVDRANVYRTDWETLNNISLPPGEHSPQAIWEQYRAAFDVERVNKAFFDDYEECFRNDVKPAARKSLNGDDEAAHQFTQLLFNRLMFCWFLQKKGWLGKEADRNYLLTLLERAQQPRKLKDGKALRSMYHDYLTFLFFEVLCNPEEKRRKHFPADPDVGTEAPFLNGGLFERGGLDERVESAPRLKQLPNSVLKSVLRDLFARYNFTVEESTSLDVQVALDPELLGSIFERLVTGRHETGSYYTPRPVVEFMCREALKGYLVGVDANPPVAASGGLASTPTNAIAQFVDHDDPSGLSDREAVLEALKRVRTCDPACGSGAYLVTMMHELFRLRLTLFQNYQLDGVTAYRRKLEIIQNNLYGVDIDDFAVNIARLRLWLSLVVENEETNWRKVEPLPNLDFKIEVGDSLIAPNPQGGTQPDLFRQEQIQRFERLKADHLQSHGEKKKALKADISSVRDEIARWAHPGIKVLGFDWRVEFAEVFMDDGFDIVLANPPYLRQEVVKQQFGDEYKILLVNLYPEACSKTTDIYVAFYVRAHQLLRQDGVGCFISSNKWLRAAYGEKLRQHLLDAQAFRLVVDFGELPVFQAAATFPAIFRWQKQPRGDTPTMWGVVKDLQACYDEGIREYVARVAQAVPASQFGKGKSRLAAPTAADRRARMEASGPRLVEEVSGQIYRGIITGLNQAYIIDRETRDDLIADDPHSEEILRPVLVGDDVRRFEVHFRGKYLIWTYVGVPIKRYPAVLRHLRRFQEKAEKRWDQGENWWELRACDFYDEFQRPKILIPAFAMSPRFALDESGAFVNAPAYFISVDDMYLLGVLNSTIAFSLLLEICSVLGDQESRGRAVLRTVYYENLPIPDAPAAERSAVGKLAQEAQRLHTQRRKRVEKFLADIGMSPAQSSSRNPLEQPWGMTPEDFTKRCKGLPVRLFNEVRDETVALTDVIAEVEKEINERVAGLYGVELTDVERR